MKLHLVDVEPDLVDCWRASSASFPEVDIQCDDILRLAHNTLVSPANSSGHMDGGIDLAYSRFFGPEVQHRVYAAIARRPEGCLPVGAGVLISTGHERIPLLIVAPTVLVPESVPAANAFRAMVAILRVAKQHANKITDIYCPGLGTGIGEIPFADTAHEMAGGYARWIEKEGAL